MKIVAVLVVAGAAALTGCASQKQKQDDLNRYLYDAINYKKLGNARQLIDMGADVDYLPKPLGPGSYVQTMLAMATQQCWLEGMDLLLSKGANLQLSAKHAVWGGVDEAWELPIKLGTDGCDHGQMLLVYNRHGVAIPTAEQLLASKNVIATSVKSQPMLSVLPVLAAVDREKLLAIDRADDARRERADKEWREGLNANRERRAEEQRRQDELMLAPIFKTGSAGNAFSAGVAAERAGRYRDAALIYERLAQQFPDSPQALEANKRLVQVDASERAVQQKAGAALMGPVCESERRKFLAAGRDPGFTCN